MSLSKFVTSLTAILSTLRPSLVGSPVSMTSGDSGWYPRANLLADGSLIGTYATISNEGSEEHKQLALARSTDQGASWGLIGTAISRSTLPDLDNPYVLQIPSGRVLLAYRNHEVDPDTGLFTRFRITLSCSDDDGKTWAYLSEAAEVIGGQDGIWEPFLRNALDGSLQIYYAKQIASNNQDVVQKVSVDGGKTWGPEKTIAGSDVLYRDGMVGVVTLTGSSLIAVFESMQDGLFQLDSVTSEDDGLTWGNRRTVYNPTCEECNAGAPQIINVGGALCVSFMTDEDADTHHWVDGASAKMLTSYDGGETWGNKTLAFEAQANWPGMVALDDRSLLFMVDHMGAKSQKIVLGPKGTLNNVTTDPADEPADELEDEPEDGTVEQRCSVSAYHIPGARSDD